MTKFSLGVIKDAFNAAVELTPTETSDDSDDDAFQDALSELPVGETSLECETDFVNALEYTKAFAQFAALFSYLNIAFAFIGKNLEASCEIINKVAVKHNAQGPVSLEKTLEYSEHDQLKADVVSSVLWLHRPLEFIISLFRRLAEVQDTVPSSEVAKQCYLETLGRHHPWPIQQMVNVLLLTLPETREVMEMMQCESFEETKKILLEVVACSQIVYDRVEKMVQRLNLQL